MHRDSPGSELDALVPAYVRRAGLPPAVVAPAAAGLGVAVWTSVGLYPPYDDGSYRVPVTLAAGALAAGFASFAARGKTVERAALRMFLAAFVGGTVLAFGCGVALTRLLERPGLGGFVLLAFYAGFFGGVASLFYVAPLVLVATSAKRAALVATADAEARSRRASGLVLAVMGYLGALFWWSAPSVVQNGAMQAHVGFLVLPALAAASGLVLAGEAQVALARRRRWLARVRAGRELFLGVRARTDADVVEGLPRLTGDAQVLELVPDRGAYRTNASRTALALV